MLEVNKEVVWFDAIFSRIFSKANIWSTVDFLSKSHTDEGLNYAVNICLEMNVNRSYNTYIILILYKTYITFRRQLFFRPDFVESYIDTQQAYHLLPL